jgi:hypothetical protein
MLKKSFFIVCASAFAYIVLFPQAVAKNIDALIEPSSKLVSLSQNKSVHAAKSPARKKISKKSSKKTISISRHKHSKHRIEKVEPKKPVEMDSPAPIDESIIASKKGDAIPDSGVDDLGN